MFLSIPHAFLLLGPVFIARVLWPAQIGDPNILSEAEGVYGRIAAKLLPAGLIGVVAAAMFSATMSTLSVAWSVRSTSFVNDIYVRFLRPAAGDREQILVGRLAVLGVGGIATSVAVFIALTSAGLFSLAQSLVGLLVTPLILPLMLGLLVRHTHPNGGMIGLFACLGFTIVNRWGYGLLGLSAPLAFEGEILVGLVVSTSAMLLSGYFARGPEWKKQTERFFSRMESARPELPLDRGIPAPLGIVGMFILLIGGLVALLVLPPQSWLDRIVILGASTVLVLIGGLMRRFAKPLGGDRGPLDARQILPK
jgi:Na+/proline symporter